MLLLVFDIASLKFKELITPGDLNPILGRGEKQIPPPTGILIIISRGRADSNVYKSIFFPRLIVSNNKDGSVKKRPDISWNKNLVKRS